MPRIVERPLIGLNGERIRRRPDLRPARPAICVDDGHLADPDVRLAARPLTSDRAIVPQVHNAGRRERSTAALHQLFADGYRPIMVVNVQAIEAADR